MVNSNRSAAQKKADINYEKKRSETQKPVKANFNVEQMEVINQAAKIVGSKKSMILEGAKLIIEKYKNNA